MIEIRSRYWPLQWVLEYNDPDPFAVLKVPVVLEYNDPDPFAVFPYPVVFALPD
jgi:hypothetical protein